MTTTNRPKFPRIAWRPVITGSVDVTSSYGSGTLDLSADIGADYWGFADSMIPTTINGEPVYVALSTSTQARLAAIVTAEANTFAGSPTVGIAAVYSWAAGDTYPVTTKYSGSGTDVDIEFDSVGTAQQFGFNAVGPHTIASSGAFLAADHQDAGSWAPRPRANRDEQWTVNPNTAVAENLDGSARKMWTWGTNLYNRSMSFPAVYVADVRVDAAANASQAAAALRVTGDPNGTLEGLLERARLPESDDDVPTFRVYTDHNVYESAYLLTGLDDLQAICENRSARRIWRVNLTFRAG